jgi:hypothetical protein
LDDATEELIGGLAASPTDLAKLVSRIHQRHRRVVVISARAVARWHVDDPRSWERVHEWLTKRGVRIVVDS